MKQKAVFYETKCGTLSKMCSKYFVLQLVPVAVELPKIGRSTCSSGTFPAASCKSST